MVFLLRGEDLFLRKGGDATDRSCEGERAGVKERKGGKYVTGNDAGQLHYRKDHL